MADTPPITLTLKAKLLLQFEQFEDYPLLELGTIEIPINIALVGSLQDRGTE